MDTEMEYLPINNIKQEIEPPTSASDASENTSNNNKQSAMEAPDSVENKVSGRSAVRKRTKRLSRVAAWETLHTTSFRRRLK
jgi:hypothetical protein